MPKRNNAQNDETRMTERRERVAGMYIEGKTQHQIAEVVGVSQMTISNDLKAIRETWKERTLRAYDEKVAQDLARLDYFEEQSWAAFRRSCRPVDADSPDKPGDPRFLDHVSKCIEWRLKILGLLKGELQPMVNNVILNFEELYGRPALEDDPVEQAIAEVRESKSIPLPVKVFPAPSKNGHH
jgi:hypothetical protein